MPRILSEACTGNKEMKKLLALSIVLLSGCSMFPKAPVVVTKPVIAEKPKLVVTQPTPANQLPIQWTVLTKDNVESKLQEMADKGESFVFFAVTPQGYQNLSLNIAELRRYIQQQNAVIATMKNYYEPEEKPTGTPVK